MDFFWYQTDTPLPSQDTLYLLHCDVKIFNVKQYKVNLALVPLLSKSHKVQAKTNRAELYKKKCINYKRQFKEDQK